MKSLFAICGVAALAACSTYDPNYTAAPPNPDPLPMQYGTIVVPANTVAVPAGTVVVPAGSTVAVAPNAISVPAGTTGAVRFDAGNGRVESVNLVSYAPSASAGSSAAPLAHSAYRMTVRMDDGLVQTLDVDNGAFRPGDRVEIRRDGRIIKR